MVKVKEISAIGIRTLQIPTVSLQCVVSNLKSVLLVQLLNISILNCLGRQAVRWVPLKQGLRLKLFAITSDLWEELYIFYDVECRENFVPVDVQWLGYFCFQLHVCLILS